MSVMLFSNNPRMRGFLPEGVVRDECAKASSFAPQNQTDASCAFACHIIPGSPLGVLYSARDKIHSGWKLLNHPLYGNYRPHQQPYRSLLVSHTPCTETDPDGITRIEPDPMSLHLLEEALGVYHSVPVLSPDAAPPSLREDCAVLDCELMRLPLLQALSQAGLPQDSLGPLA